MAWGKQMTSSVNADDDHSYSQLDFLSDDGETDPAKTVELGDDWTHLKSLFKKLSEKQRQVMELRFGLNGNQSMTLGKAGQLMGLTQERVRQIQIGALKQLREMYC